MANRTLAEQIVVLETERDRLETAIATAQAGNSSFSIDGISGTRWRLSDLRAELTRVQKSLQRLYRGGRGVVLDMSSTSTADANIPATYLEEST